MDNCFQILSSFFRHHFTFSFPLYSFCALPHICVCVYVHMHKCWCVWCVRNILCLYDVLGLCKRGEECSLKIDLSCPQVGNRDRWRLLQSWHPQLFLIWRLMKIAVSSDWGWIVPGCSQGVFPRLEISEGLCVVRLRSDCARLFTGFTGLEISEGLCVVRLRSDCARLFTGFAGLEITEGLCVVRLRLGEARLFPGGISSFGD